MSLPWMFCDLLRGFIFKFPKNQQSFVAFKPEAEHRTETYRNLGMRRILNLTRIIQR